MNLYKYRDKPVETYKHSTTKKLVALKRCLGCRSNLSRYDLTLPERDALLESQDGKCKICKKDITFGKSYNDEAVVDHDHSFKKNHRGILCRECNSGIGYFKDNINSLKNAIKYLKG